MKKLIALAVVAICLASNPGLSGVNWIWGLATIRFVG